MADEREGRRGNDSREYRLPPSTYLHIQDGTSGKIKTHVGPTAVTLTGNDQPIVFDFFKSGEDGRKAEFRPCDTLKEAVRESVIAPDGFYAVLMNPAKNNIYPNEGDVKPSPDLDVGNKIVVSGPRMFALWPGQSATVIRGHHLRSNQFLICRVYNEVEARKNWSEAKMVKAVVATTVEDPSQAQGQGQASSQVQTTPVGIPGKAGTSPLVDEKSASSATEDAMVEQLTVGKLLIIKGTDYSFFIPPTGISVLFDSESNTYVRDAITLEQLQYCLLLDEDGEKRYVHGPAVVFPEPTEMFVKDAEGNSIFRAVEMNKNQGLHIRVSKAYKDEILGDLKEGQEIFITGEKFPIYFPREEHIIIRYDGNVRYYAVNVPEGTGRYVQNRMTGVIRLAKGPQMLLPNPIDEILTRRFLTDKECRLWYPGNEEALEYNQHLREISKTVPTTRAGTVSEGDVKRGSLKKGMESLRTDTEIMYSSNSMRTRGLAGATGPQGSQGAPAHKAARSALMASSNVSNSNLQLPGDEVTQASTFTAPRSLILNTKFEGAPRIEPYTGYAVMIVDSKSERRVVQGPANILLEYGERLESLTLSTGKPKTTDDLIETVYLQVMNNKVTDVVRLETGDQVVVDVKLSYLVNFEGDSSKWWNVENYVKFLCDHMRSLLKAAAKEVGIEALYGNPLPFVQKVVLGADKAGTTFEENGMVVSDVEVLETKLADEEVAKMLKDTQRETVRRSITLADERRGLEALKESEKIKMDGRLVVFQTESKQRQIEKETLDETLEIALKKIEGEITGYGRKLVLQKAQEEVTNLKHGADLARDKLAEDQRLALAAEQQKIEIEMLVAEAESVVKRMSALQGGMTEALLTISSRETLVKISESLSVQKLAGGQDVVDVLGKIFENSPLGKLMENIGEKAGLVNPTMNGSVSKQLSADAKS